ncbi:MAG: hypothetical protein M3Y06_09505 [Actinomycetota bacterium]|nr:hypothetical protein [Actinomycetota bacterium]
MVKVVVAAVIGAFLVFYMLTSPDQAAEIVRGIGHFASKLAHGVGHFIDKLAS